MCPASFSEAITLQCVVHAQKEAEAHHDDMTLFENCESEDGLTGWAPSGSCKLSVHDDPDPHAIPPLAATAGDEDDDDEAAQRARKPSGRYVLATHRTDEKDGLCREISRAPRPKVTYRVGGWVGVGGEGSHVVQVKVCVGEGRPVGGGVVVVEPGKWGEIKGSFRVDDEDEQPRSAKVYVCGPAAGVDLKVMDLRVCAVNKIPRLRHLRKKADKVRKRDVILKLNPKTDDEVESVAGAEIRVVQVQNSFPIGSCINKSGITNPAYVDFFTKHFDWAVLENELNRGSARCPPPTRSAQPWRPASAAWWPATPGRFPHYEVNNEMLHGHFFKDRLGDDVDAHMFRETAAIDPAPALFVNDYNVESGNDPDATPDKYVALITDLQKRGAPVGGIGVQGHVTHPVGDVICDALDKLAVTGLPIWITELDVSAADDNVRADDLEIVLREAYAHPAVEGLVNQDGKYTVAGHRFAGLRNEWMSHAMGKVDSNGHFKFRGFHGTYQVMLKTGSGKVKHQLFDVNKGDTPLVLDMNL
ncbi:hypothetical protein PR202_gb26537 [Eleusine coracana subsp. coracana]|uniref:GH10 domain-containing protein n=1 Tax=Eleusine coracana subsp. coracana TaxID=191504 RepID=A0AAV5FS64_ELECO|nr:hypothetical protein PR202_gb26537 [Eleusine coracana subsp. coracana]